MTEPILDPKYWRERLALAKKAGELHSAVFRCSLERWIAIEIKHREILKRLIGDGESILDAGCGWGRLLTLLPLSWRGRYLGIDLSPDFITLAEQLHPKHAFLRGDVRGVLQTHEKGHRLVREDFDWAILISVRPMVKRNLGDEEWAEIEWTLRQQCKKLLYLEYDPSDEGSVE